MTISEAIVSAEKKKNNITKNDFIIKMVRLICKNKFVRTHVHEHSKHWHFRCCGKNVLLLALLVNQPVILTCKSQS